MKKPFNKKHLTIAGLGLFVAVGFFNAVVINSDSHVASSGFFKRLDEMTGIITEGRKLASTTEWKKLPTTQRIVKAPTQIVKNEVINMTSVDAPIEHPAEAVIQDQLNLQLVDVANPKKWKDGLKKDQFQGVLTSANGTIETLDVSLPNGQSLEVSLTEMAGNVFEYEFNGEKFSGMMYQVDQNNYTVTLTNGPLEGTRLSFAAEVPQTEEVKAEETKNYLAEKHNVEAGSFGEEAQTSAEVAYEETAPAAASTFQF